MSIAGFFCQSIAGFFIESRGGMRGCADLACDRGACCFIAGFRLCIDNMPRDACPVGSFVRFTKDTPCELTDCGPNQFGACCGCSVPTGPSYHCQNTSIKQCATLGGTFLGDGTFCELLPSGPVTPGGSTCNYVDCLGQGFGNSSVGGCCFTGGGCGSLPQCHCDGSCNPFGGVRLGTFMGPGKNCTEFGQLCPNKGMCCNSQTGNCNDAILQSACISPNTFYLHEKCERGLNPKCPGRCNTGCGSQVVCVDNIPKSHCPGNWSFSSCP